MSENKITGVAITSIKQLIIHVLKLGFIALGWCLQVAGMVLSKIGSSIQQIVLKKSSV
jgi:hypothetical protein